MNVVGVAGCALIAAVLGASTSASADAPPVATVAVDGTAFHDASGIVSVNQSSGNGNTSFNLVRIGTMSLTPIADASLRLLAVGRRELGGTTAFAQARVTLSPGAFVGAHGVVQLNQIAGSQNSSNNEFVLRIAAP